MSDRTEPDLADLADLQCAHACHPRFWDEPNCWCGEIQYPNEAAS